MSKYFNTNSVHNFLNTAIAVLGILSTIMIGLGCAADKVTGKLDCAGVQVLPVSWLPYLTAAAGAIGVTKLIMNIVRDGIGGILKQQPPVATDVKTVVVTGAADTVTKVKTQVIDGPSVEVPKVM